MSEIYTSTERTLIFCTIAVVSLVASIVYLFYRVDYKRVSVLIFIVCLINASLFIFLDILGMFDLVFSGQAGFEKFSKTISRFYFIYSIIDKIFGYIILDAFIFYLESGYYHWYQKLFDFFKRRYDSITKLGVCGLIVRLCIAVPLIAGLLAILIINRKRYEMEYPWDYLFTILDIYGIFEIYSSVGFFIIQVILDYKRKKNEHLIHRYYRYSIIKIIAKTEKYVEKMKNSYDSLAKEVLKLNKQQPSDYTNYLRETLKEMEENINSFDLKRNDINNNNINNIKDFAIFNYNNNRNNNRVIQFTAMNNEMNILKDNPNSNVHALESRNNNNMVTIAKSTQRKDEKKEKEKEYDIPTSIRKYKKSVRRIIKLKKLYRELYIERDTDLREINKKCTIRYIILFIALSIAILTDFLVPFLNDPDDDFYDDNGEEYEKGKSKIGLVAGILLCIVVSIICSSYTIIIIYSTKRKRYITWDFLYDKQINDNLNLLKTVSIVCGYSFSLVYCNLYFWRAIDNKGDLGKPNFYKETIVPDYKIKGGLSVYMIIKIVVIITSMILNAICSNFFIYQNDLAEFNLSQYGCIYDSDIELNKILSEKNKINNILIN